jgi:(R,R)-butanediol dehydrogenase/meso-butanediol dehydrogenase/diacetyl reductase
MTVAWHAVRLAEVTPEDAVVIAGAGPIGLGLFLALRAQGGHRGGVENVVLSEPSAEVRALVSPERPTVGFDAAGSAAAFTAVLGLLGLLGRMVVVAIHTREFPFNPTMALLARERSVLHSYACPAADFREVIDAMAQGHYPTTGWVATRPARELEDDVEELKDGRGTKVPLEI